VISRSKDDISRLILGVQHGISAWKEDVKLRNSDYANLLVLGIHNFQVSK
jgi:hypothetical protein